MSIFKILFSIYRGKQGAETYDVASPDIVGHLLEGMAEADIYDE